VIGGLLPFLQGWIFFVFALYLLATEFESGRIWVKRARRQWPALSREGYRYEAVLNPREPGLRDVLVLMGPGTLGLAATQVNVFVNTWLATSQGTGAVSWLNYAFRLMYLPLGLFGVSIATASVPAIARRAAERDLDGLRRTLSSGVAMMLALTIPRRWVSWSSRVRSSRCSSSAGVSRLPTRKPRRPHSSATRSDWPATRS
jgi:O-antigen/teichoic acid export membrane protein